MVLGPLGTGGVAQKIQNLHIVELLFVNHLTLGGTVKAEIDRPHQKSRKTLPLKSTATWKTRRFLPLEMTNESSTTLLDLFSPPFWAITLKRSMPLFKNALALEPGVAGMPHPDFLVRLLSQYPSTLSMTRDLLGDQYKNLENFVGGRHKPSETTLSLIAARLGCETSELDSLVGTSPSDPLLPGFEYGFRLYEGIPLRFFAALAAHELNCPHCGANLWNDMDAWWQNREAQPLDLDRPEYMFAERLIAGLMGGSILHALAFSDKPENNSIELTLKMTNPKHHPIGNWIRLVKSSYRCDTLKDLEGVLSRKAGKEGDTTEARLKKWSSGQDLIPLEKGLMIAATSPEAQALTAAFFSARVVAFIIDLLYASDRRIASSRKDAQNVVHERIAFLRDKLWLAMSTIRAPSMGLI